MKKKRDLIFFFNLFHFPAISFFVYLVSFLCFIWLCFQECRCPCFLEHRKMVLRFFYDCYSFIQFQRSRNLFNDFNPSDSLVYLTSLYVSLFYLNNFQFFRYKQYQINLRKTKVSVGCGVDASLMSHALI